MLAALSVLAVAAGCSSTDDADPDAAPTSSAAPAVDDEQYCEAWASIFDAQVPAMQVDDASELAEPFRRYADAVEAASSALPADEREVLDEVVVVVRDFADDPSSPAANRAMGELLGPANGIALVAAGRCSLDPLP